MPLYQCIVPKGSLSYESRQEIAEAFTDVHCGISAAPRSFVHVFFLESSGDAGGEYDTTYYIAGRNRAGRPPEVKAQILDGLIVRFCEIAGVGREDVSGHIMESPSSWSMEAGHILPEPGEEPAEWYEHASARS